MHDKGCAFFQVPYRLPLQGKIRGEILRYKMTMNGRKNTGERFWDRDISDPQSLCVLEKCEYS